MTEFTDSYTHVVVGIDQNNSLKPTAMRELRADMDVIAWSQNTSDADAVRRVFQEKAVTDNFS